MRESVCELDAASAKEGRSFPWLVKRLTNPTINLLGVSSKAAFSILNDEMNLYRYIFNEYQSYL